MSEDTVTKAKADLIYAILTMDSYNRGYGSGITGLLDDIDTKIGNFLIKATVPVY